MVQRVFDHRGYGQTFAAKHDAKLSPLNPRRITAIALHAWHTAGRKAGVSPKKGWCLVGRGCGLQKYNVRSYCM